MDIWINDLSANNTFPLPIPVVTDPLQGTQFHSDVYAPVPEPSSVAALVFGLAGMGGVVIRRRQRSSGVEQCIRIAGRHDVCAR